MNKICVSLTLEAMNSHRKIFYLFSFSDMDTLENSVCARILRQCVRINVVTVMTIHRGRHSSRSHDNGSYRVRFSFPARQLRIRSPLSRLRAYVLFALIGARNNEPVMRRGQKRSRRRRWELETAVPGRFSLTCITQAMAPTDNSSYRKLGVCMR